MTRSLREGDTWVAGLCGGLYTREGMEADTAVMRTRVTGQPGSREGPSGWPEAQRDRAAKSRWEAWTCLVHLRPLHFLPKMGHMCPAPWQVGQVTDKLVLAQPYLQRSFGQVPSSF